MADFWEAMRNVAQTVGPLRPVVGQRCKVYRGMHKGKVGRIIWHGRDRYSDAFRYGNEASMQMREMLGRYGFRVGIEPENGGERFFTSAEYIVTEAADGARAT